jgi:hypothetical protein
VPPDNDGSRPRRRPSAAPGSDERAPSLGAELLRVSAVDATNATSPGSKQVYSAESSGYYYNYSGDSATLVFDQLLLARGNYGVKVIDIAP